jgi:pyruvate dehydrogenase E2 component (dihydrolipoamide acetyltransferase)
MATEVKLPRLGQGMESGTIVKWLKGEGEPVKKREPLYELDTDKVTQEVEAEADGVLLKIVVPSGEVEVGRTIAFIGNEGEDVPSDNGGQPAETRTEEPETEEEGEEEDAAEPDEQPEEEGSPADEMDDERERGRQAAAATAEAATAAVADAPATTAGRVKASPLARRLAREKGIDIAQLQGSGPEGRIVAEDVERGVVAEPTAAPAAAQVAPTGEVEEIELTSTRKTIARRLTEAWQAPVFQLSLSVDMSRALELRKRLVELHGDGVKPTISDLLTKVCAAALLRHRAVNALYKGDAVELYPTANIGIAVAVPNGLIVPVIPSCERKSVAEIAAERGVLVERARAGKLQQADLEGGTFTISNLGMYGIEQFVAVLNPPQAAILAVGATEDKVVVVEGEIVVRPRMEVTLTCDHRAVDGATGAEFLRDVKAFLEEPGLAL